jgi:hypothetical protein
LKLDIEDNSHFFLSGKFSSDSPARGPGHKPQTLLLSKIIDLEHNAINVET